MFHRTTEKPVKGIKNYHDAIMSYQKAILFPPGAEMAGSADTRIEAFSGGGQFPEAVKRHLRDRSGFSGRLRGKGPVCLICSEQ